MQVSLREGYSQIPVEHMSSRAYQMDKCDAHATRPWLLPPLRFAARGGREIY